MDDESTYHRDALHRALLKHHPQQEADQLINNFEREVLDSEDAKHGLTSRFAPRPGR